MASPEGLPFQGTADSSQGISPHLCFLQAPESEIQRVMYAEGAAHHKKSRFFYFVPIEFSQTWWTFLKPAKLSKRSVASINPQKYHSTRRARILCMHRGSGIMTGSRVALVGRLSRFSGKRLKRQRRSCWGFNVLSPTANLRECWLLRDASILNWKEIRWERAKWSSSKLHFSFYYVTIKSWG